MHYAALRIQRVFRARCERRHLQQSSAELAAFIERTSLRRATAVSASDKSIGSGGVGFGGRKMSRVPGAWVGSAPAPASASSRSLGGSENDQLQAREPLADMGRVLSQVAAAQGRLAEQMARLERRLDEMTVLETSLE